MIERIAQTKRFGKKKNVGKTIVDKKTIEELKALGYID
jgi:hypothetical protein